MDNLMESEVSSEGLAVETKSALTCDTTDPADSIICLALLFPDLPKKSRSFLKRAIIIIYKRAKTNTS